jgi:hypothetical protein
MAHALLVIYQSNDYRACTMISVVMFLNQRSKFALPWNTIQVKFCF